VEKETLLKMLKESGMASPPSGLSVATLADVAAKLAILPLLVSCLSANGPIQFPGVPA